MPNAKNNTEGHPVSLGPNQPATFYRGSGSIATFRSSAGQKPGQTATVASAPEDWVASTVTQFGQPSAGLTMLPTGETLRDAVRADPEFWLGRSSGRQDAALEIPLVKILDAGQRLPVHAHPDNHFAHTHLGLANGKTEAWNIIATNGEGIVHLGWSRPVDPEQLATWVATQNTDAMLDAMNRLAVEPGDTVYVPAGLPHAIGQGILLVEVQQAADASILLEWTGFTTGTPDDSFCGLEEREAIQAVTTTATDPQELHRYTGRGELESDQPRSVILPSASREFFSAEVLVGDVSLEPSYRTLVVLSGTGTLRTDVTQQDIASGETLAVPAGAGEVRIAGSARILAFGPAQDELVTTA